MRIKFKANGMVRTVTDAAGHKLVRAGIASEIAPPAPAVVPVSEPVPVAVLPQEPVETPKPAETTKAASAKKATKKATRAVKAEGEAPAKRGYKRRDMRAEGN